MLNGFEPIPKFKRIFHLSTYHPKWAIIFMCPILIMIYIFFLPRIIKIKITNTK
jgi:hypothetical protein